MEDMVMNEALEDVPTETQAPEPPQWICQVDASWISSRETSGLEAEGLIWAMQESLNRGYMSLHFESDCQQLVNLIQRDDEEWPAWHQNWTKSKLCVLASTLSLLLMSHGLSTSVRMAWQKESVHAISGFLIFKAALHGGSVANQMEAV
ncbi:hypothetical protein F2Q69_00058189 [Brassica cretica]|uniref:RNase H type-1 domain-containing protein n=1 Tax=Brassica cretica TaxID=69181 RepID=A0A8S9RIK5_BRACR|nr:hypothetical protein F2Q69_00058189 [Brassica cretica]